MEAVLNGDAGRVVVITGGSSGIGRCTATLFARRGWRVGLIARGVEALAESCGELEALGARAATAQADVTDSDALRAAARALVSELGAIDLWINCAGAGVYGRFAEVPEADFKRVTDVTYHGSVNGVREALRLMAPRGKGTILNVCSAVVFHGLPLMTSYSGAKAAVCAFSRALQAELRFERSAIRITTVFPPAVNTPFFDHATSYMGWPARPAWPVYQPEVIAQGIWQAFVSGRHEMTISGTSFAFRAASRMTPGLVAWCVARMGMERQAAKDSTASQLQEPTLFVPSRHVFGIRGPFGKGARTRSIQLWLESGLTRLALLFGSGRGDRAMRPVVPLPPTHAPADPERARADLAEQAGTS